VSCISVCPPTASSARGGLPSRCWAGLNEEITWRGVQTALLSNLIGRLWLAAIICSISFGLGHMVQGWKSSAIIVVFALGFQLLVWLSGSLYVAMIVHIAYDITAGLSYGRLGKEFGYSAELPEPPQLDLS
jgi:membrane protease YdiL (CAAX protease family)